LRGRSSARSSSSTYRDGRVDKVLVSGDHGRVGYDEVGTMRRELLRLGVPAGDIFEDHAGFDTWASVVRARRVFAVHSAVVVTQRFHLARALWLARRAGLHATGLAADARGYGAVERTLEVREVVARVKAVTDVVTGAAPRFLGPQHPITGDGRTTLG
jgi:SanA protein